ncbi:MAG: HAMP domain-containing sensor histidine kinase [Clostridia bacterium]|nr:HAMP domain-containing sensor histidine kinase [Clostridia bacterium]
MYEAKNSLDESAGFTMDLINESAVVPEAQIQKFAKVEGVTVALLNRQKEITYSTDDNNNPPGDLTRNPSGLFFSNGRVYVNYPVQGDEAVSYILVSKSLEKETMYLLVLLAALTVSFIPAVLFMVIKGWKTLKKMLKPIDDMIGTARSISARDLHTRLNVVDSHDELKELAETFNEMMDRIQISYEQQNRFVSDASHELRTPIAVIQGYANLLQRWGKEQRETLDESVSAIKNEADNMQLLVERLLFLARADKDTQKVEKTAFSLNELIDELVRETRLIDSEHEIISETNAIVSLVADRSLIKQALRIFIDNSIKFTPPGGTIKINSCLGDNQLSVMVEDNGVGISTEDLPYVFNRFYKCDKSRIRESGGTGLGLSIAKWIIEKHRGAIDIESALNKGTKTIIKLPVYQTHV